MDDLDYYTNIDYNNILIHHISNNDIEITKSILNSSVNIDINYLNCSGLNIASDYGYFEIVKLLIEHGADAKIMNSQCLYNAIHGFKYDIALYLVEHDANLKMVSEFLEKYEPKNINEFKQYLRINKLNKIHG